MKKAKPAINPLPLELVRGKQVAAEYLVQEVPEFQGNPLIEPQPPLWTKEEVIEMLTYFPPYSDEYRKKSEPARLHMLENAREFFVPHGKHLEVHHAISNMLRRGYVQRNPIMWGFWLQQEENLKKLKDDLKKRPFPSSKARGFAMVGVGGTGKSTTVEKILQMYPQVIIHSKYKDQEFVLKQLVWLKLDCPRMGSLKSLCLHFFEAVDDILGTEYSDNYGSRYRTLDELLIDMARVASNHCLGVLVIDEIQDLSEAKSGGDSSMLSFFVHLENRIGVPFVLVGTPQAIPILSGQFRQARRVSEQGDVIWDRMSEVKEEIEGVEDNDDEDYNEEEILSNTVTNRENQEEEVDPVWRDFVQTLWAYQYVKNVTQLKENLLKDKRARALYAVSKGIPAVALTIYVLTQRRAIVCGVEKITSGIIRSVAHDSQNLIKSMLDTPIRRPKTIPSVADLTDWNYSHEELDDYEDSIKQELLSKSNDQIPSINLEAEDPPKISQKENRKHTARKVSNKGAKPKKPAKNQKIFYSKNDLRNLVNNKIREDTVKPARRSKLTKSLTKYV
jgi:hypothetical protein